MKILIYKRTHTGDPNEDGVFGCEDCMGSIRSHKFDAVIGVGGKGAEARSYCIDDRVNWIGIGPHREKAGVKRGPEVSFDHFVLYEDEGELLEELAPGLAKRFYEQGVRHMKVCEGDPEYAEANEILAVAADAPPSPARLIRRKSSSSPGGCKSRKKRRPCEAQSMRN